MRTFQYCSMKRFENQTREKHPLQDLMHKHFSQNQGKIKSLSKWCQTLLDCVSLEKTGKLEVESIVIYQVTFFWVPLQLEIWSIQHSKQQLGDVWCHDMLLLVNMISSFCFRAEYFTCLWRNCILQDWTTAGEKDKEK